MPPAEEGVERLHLLSRQDELAVADALEEETGGGGRPGGDVEAGVLFGLEEQLEIAQGDFALTQFDEDTGEAADHAPDEVGSLDAEEDFVFEDLDCGALDDDD